MGGTEESQVTSTAVSDVASGLRLRPVKVNRGGETPEKSDHGIPNNSYLEETWEDEPMTPAGRVFTEMNSTFVCVCILGFKNPIDPQKFKSHLELTLMKHKRFSSRVDTRNGIPWWTQVKTNVDNHVFEVELTPEQKEDKNCVLNYTTDVVLHKPFDESRPLWDVHLVEAKLGNAEGCCILRIHHSLGDGTSLISLLMACTRSVDKPDMLPKVATANQDKRSASPPPVGTSSFMSNFFAAIWHYLLVFWYSVIEIGKAGATLLWMKDSRTVISGYAGMTDLPRKYRFITIRADDIKSLSKAMGVTINDVFMAMAAHGLRQYLQERAEQDFNSEEISDTNQHQAKDGKITASEAQKHISKGLEPDGLLKKLDSLRIRAVALINMRAAPGLQELSEMMNGQASQARWGNHMGYLLLPLPMKRYSDPLELLRKVQAIGISKKSSFEGAFSYASGSLVMKLFGQKVAAAVVTRAALQTTMSLSNVKGPTEHVTFADNPIVHIIPSVVGHPHTLTLHLQSYNGEIAIIAMAMKKLLPDPERFLELCVEGLEELKKAANE
ncbi:unnamed protein product [Calypogeia fissa]